MGVMSCSRKYCENIMCDTYIDDIGYICSDCKNEFKEYLVRNKLTDLDEFQIKKELKKFMKISKDGFTKGDKIDIDDFFNEYTIK